MTEPSQYFRGRTVQEQMDEVIGYVDKRAEEVAAAEAGAVLQPAEQAKTAAQAAAEAAEAAKDTTLAALPEIRQDISGLKAEDVALDGRLDTVELKVQTAEGNIVTIQGQIVALQNAQGDYVKKDGAAQTVTSQIMVPTTATSVRDTQIANGTRIQNDLDNYTPMVRTTGNQVISGIKQFTTKVEFSSVFDNKTSQNVETTSTWRRVYVNTVVNASNQMLLLAVTPQKPALMPDDYGLLMVGGATSSPVAKWIVKGVGINTANFVAVATVEGYLEVWVKNASGNAGLSLIKLHETNWGTVDNKWTADISTTDASFDPTDTTKYSAYTVSS